MAASSTRSRSKSRVGRSKADSSAEVENSAAESTPSTPTRQRMYISRAEKHQISEHGTRVTYQRARVPRKKKVEPQSDGNDGLDILCVIVQIALVAVLDGFIYFNKLTMDVLYAYYAFYLVFFYLISLHPQRRRIFRVVAYYSILVAAFSAPVIWWHFYYYHRHSKLLKIMDRM
ncbi:hypothetical protein Dda_1091 [Drechslerella dactyloides]|uniref:Uncharacterized protein n=1 Tax=Drechslerella dactyloides TaxID=74499 RepID=A0AAD6NPH3_DREDA|nr:hypothetical protein Dda_1091 [Drechslerella dactyloides]